MKLAFIPGDLHLSDSPTGYVLTRGNTEVFRTQSERAAVTRFNRLRNEIEKNGLKPLADSKPPEIAPSISQVDVTSRETQLVPRGRKKKPTARSGAARPKRIKGRGRAPKDATPHQRPPRLNTHRILAELRQQRERVERAIAEFELLDAPANSRRQRP